MAVFRKVPPDGQKGKISYNAGIVSGIVNLAVSEVDIEYGESLERVELVIKDNLPAIREEIPDIEK